MSDTSPPPLAPGEFFDSSAGHDGEQFEGREFTFADVNETTGAKRSYKDVVRRIVKNDSGITLNAKMLCQLNPAGTAITGYAITGIVTTIAAAGGSMEGVGNGVGDIYPLDEYIPSAGLADGDWGYVVVQGSAICITAKVVTIGDTAAGNRLIPATATDSTGQQAHTLGGRVGCYPALVGITRIAYDTAAIGRALSAMTSNLDVLVKIGGAGGS
tara:strand:+ start:443 stop:1084 length:642 start_codon:yes stop_codon:yes gene_type:complete